MTNPAKTNVPERYVKALDSADPLPVLRKMPKRLRKLLRAAKEKELAWKPDAATWSVHEIVGHLADNEFVLGARLRFVAAEERPLLPAYDEKRFVAGLGLERATLEDLFDAWVAARAANVHLLDRLPEGAWTRTGVHSERGELSLLQLVIGAAGHDRVHEEQIERTIARARAVRREEKQRRKSASKAEAKTKRRDRPARADGDGRAKKSDRRAARAAEEAPETRAGERAGERSTDAAAKAARLAKSAAV
jgi:hypothetical protein